MYEQSRHRNPLRYLAPVALAAIVLATYLVIQHNVSSSSGNSGATSTTTSSHTSRNSKTSGTKHVKSKYYKVRSGDSLSVISARTGISLPTLESLNPGVSSGNLQVGQRLKLRR